MIIKAFYIFLHIELNFLAVRGKIKSNQRKTVQIKEKTKIGKHVLEMLKALARNDDSIRFPDETDYLLSSEANKEVFMEGINII